MNAIKNILKKVVKIFGAYNIFTLSLQHQTKTLLFNNTLNNIMNAKNIINAFNSDNNSFNRACRFILDTAKIKQTKLPAEPAKDDQTEEAIFTRAERKRIAKVNDLIADCMEVKNAVGLTDGKDKTLSDLFATIKTRIPFVDAEGHAVKFVALPKNIKDLAGVKVVYKVVPATWIETLLAIAENPNVAQEQYDLTTAPELDENGEIAKGMQGDIITIDKSGVNAVDVDTYGKIAVAWQRHTIATNKANNAVKAEREKVYKDNISSDK